ncbi:MAG: insulinase family protein [Gammaproteobacteria bacterium]|nr:insulinase family protein [Gammaproteobacteria bacterium]
MRRTLLAAAFCGVFPSLSLAAVTTHEFKLDNGMKVIVKEDHRAPVVVSQVWYKVGSSYEHNGTTGLSHALEHMMFKGTKKHPPNEFSRIISENGGKENAFTGEDYTTYFQQLEKSRLAISFELEADRMRNIVLPPEEFAKEIKVIMEERRMRTDDNPNALMHEQFNAAAFVNSPYHHPVIGWMDDLEHMTVQDLRNWYQTWYTPNNATLVVVGDVDAKETLALAKKYFGPLKSNPVPVVKPQQEIEQVGTRRIIVKAPAELPSLVMGYKTPGARSAKDVWEIYALDMLAGILDGGDSARFAKNLVRGSQVAANAGAGYDAFGRLDQLFTLDGTPAQGHTIQELETALRAQVKKVRDEVVSDDELERVKAQVIASKVYERDSSFYQAMQIGMLETVGLPWKLADEYLDRIKAVTPQQVQQVAQKYLIDDTLTIAVLDPLPLTKPVNQMPMGGNHVR